MAGPKDKLPRSAALNPRACGILFSSGWRLRVRVNKTAETEPETPRTGTRGPCNPGPVWRSDGCCLERETSGDARSFEILCGGAKNRASTNWYVDQWRERDWLPTLDAFRTFAAEFPGGMLPGFLSTV